MRKSESVAIGPGHARHARGLFAFILAALVLSGCGAGHFYNAENDKTATAAKEAADELNLAAVVAQERNNQAKLLTHEIAVVSDFAVTRRNTALRALLETRRNEDGTIKRPIEPLSTKLQRFINERLKTITGTDNIDDINGILDLEQNLRDEQENLGTSRRDFRLRVGVEPPACPAGESNTFDVTDEMVDRITKGAANAGKKLTKRRIKRSLNFYKARCQRFLDAWSSISSVGGLLDGVVEEWRKASEVLERETAGVREARKEYEVALKAYKEAVEAVQKDTSAKTKDELKKAVKSIREALGALAGASDLGNLEAVNEQIEKIDLLLEAAAKGELNQEKLKKADERTNRAVAIASLLPGLVEQTAAISALAKVPPVNALLFEKERLLAQKQAADRAVERTRSRRALLERKRDALFRELDVLIQATQYIDWAVRENNGGQIKIDHLTRQSIGETARRYMVMAVASYLNSFTGPRQLVHETEYRLIDVDHAEALDRSETSLRLWESAVKQPVTVLAAYHGSGLRTEDIIELLKAAGLFVISARVD